jgi:hypothetical protein
MCASHREPVHEAAEAAQRDLEEEEEARLASASLAAGDLAGWFDHLYAAGFTMTTRPTHRSRPGHCGELRSKRSVPAD